MKKITFTILLLILGVTGSNAQQYSYRHYTIFDGLPQNQCMKVYQDSKGFIWVATKGGVSRFDGQKFQLFLDGQSIHGFILNFFEFNHNLFLQSTQEIYVLNENHFLPIFKTSRGQIRNFSFDTRRLEACTIINNDLYYFTAKGYKRIGLKSNIDFYSATIFGNNEFLLTSSKGIFHLLTNGKMKQESFNCSNNVIKIREKYYFSSYAIENKATDGCGIYLISDSGISPVYTPKGQIINNISYSKNNHLYFNQDYSTWVKIDSNGGRIDSDSLPGININDILVDHYNNIWLATETGLFELQSYAFRNYDEKSGMPKYVWSIFEDSSHAMIFASYNGILAKMKNEKLKEVENYKNHISDIEQFYFSGICNSFGQWMIPTNFRILINDNGNYRFLNPMHNGKHVSILSLCEDKSNNNVYIGTTQGLYIYNLISKKTKHYYTGIGNVLGIEKDRNNRFWIATGKDIFILEKDVIIPIEKAGIEIEGGAMALKEDFKGNMWYAAKGELHFNFHQGDISISDKQYYFISEYKKKYIIAGSITGFLLVDLDKFYAGKSNSMRFFDRYNGFSGIECGQNGTCVDTKGNVWIPTSESVVKFMPERLSFDTIPPPVFIYTFETAASDLRFDTIESLPEKPDSIYHINHTSNNIRISFQGLSYPCPERIRYRYRLFGNSDVWNETNESEITFTNLNPGNYRFEVIACNENGFWTKTPTTFSFHIVPAFWQTLFFKIAMLVLLAASTGLIVFWLMKRKRMKEKKEQEVERQLINMQVGTINSQLDPHFIFNAITAIGSEVQEKNTDVAYAYFVKVSQLLRNSLKNSGTITRSLAEEMQFVENYLSLQKFRFGERFMFEIVIANATNMDFVVPKMCIQIFVENAVKHGLENRFDGGILLVSVSHNAEGLHVSIKDNGIGRRAASKLNSQSTGVGLKAFREFFEIMNRYNQTKAGFEIEDLYDIKGNPEGTVVKLFIPAGYKYVVN